MTLVVLAMGATFASAVSVFMFCKSLAKQSVEPEVIRRTAQQIAQLPDPLPPGYKYQLCIPFAPFITSVSIMHEDDKQLITLFSALAGSEQDPKEMASRAFDMGINPLASISGDEPTPVLRFQEVKSKGEETIAGQKMPYIVGEIAGPSGTPQDDSGQAKKEKADKKERQGMVGCICVKEAKKIILIYALQTSDSPYNQQVTMDLLKTIKGF